jgi:uncharacterized protein DUF2779
MPTLYCFFIMLDKTRIGWAGIERTPFISKSTFLSGLQCSKLLWYRYNAKDQIPAPDDEQQAIFDQGHEVGGLAKSLFPDGIEIGKDITDLDETIRLTKDAVKLRRPLFEAAFTANGGYFRVDILNPVSEDSWDIIEVKSTTGLKDVHLNDLAFQAWVLTNAGLKIRKTILMHINSDFVRRGTIDPAKFFAQEDVTSQISSLSQNIEAKLSGMFKIIHQKEHPNIQIGPHCDNPYTCPLHEHCWSFLPAANIFTLYRGGKKSLTLFEQGIYDLAEIPENFQLTDNQEIQRTAQLTGKAHIDRPALAAFLKQIEYPISFLDFETFGTAIPMVNESRPYQQIPFQFSLHILQSENAGLEHHPYLAEGAADPRPEFMRRLKSVLPGTGSVITYNASFEASRLEEMSELLPEFESWVKQIKSRMVDLLLPFRGFRYYHPNQHGSASIKAVLPVLAGRDYQSLSIQEGGTASREYLRVTFTDVPVAERNRVRRALEEYCGQDTMGMFWIVENLKKLAAG